MHGARFDRLARTFGKRVSRRTALGGAAAFALVSGRVSAATTANQLTPSTCGASGDVCTLLMGCCDGLTCVTSAINVNYGVCVAGEGGTIAGGTSLISPFSENAETEAAAVAAAQTTSTTSTTTSTTETDPDLVREQRRDEKQTRRTSRRTEQKSRRTTRKDTIEDRRLDQQETREERRGPKLMISLSESRSEGDPEVIRVINRDDTSVFIARIEVLPDRRDRPTVERTLQSGKSLFLLSGLPNGTDVEDDEFLWGDQTVCVNPVEGAGFAISAGFSEFEKNREFIILCDGSDPNGVGGNGRPRKKKRKARNKNKNKH